jgi:hypothetical protein
VPSIFSVATGIWKPSDEEVKANLQAGFGATIAVRHPNMCDDLKPQA